MPVKSLSEMSFADLAVELQAAKNQQEAARYQEQLNVMQRLLDAARTRYDAVKAEIDLRLSRLDAAGGVPMEEPTHGG
jgi:hypothetical protein